MNFKFKLILKKLALMSLLLSIINIYSSDGDIEKEPFIYKSGDSEFRFSTKFKPEFFYGKNLRLLNDCNDIDRVVYLRHTVDAFGEYHFGHASRGYDVVLAKFNLRNKAVWGDPESIFRTTVQVIKDLEVVHGPHSHAVARLIPWIREMWLRISIPDMIGWIPFENHHYLTLGAFPFELGRGISLGSSYTLGPEAFLGYRSENTIDQFAMGLKLSGDFIEKKLSYDLYSAILDNKSGSWAYTSEKIRGGEYGKKYNQHRGFGVINYVLGGRLRWKPISGKDRYTIIEPYVMYADTKEQRLFFAGDSKAKLGSFGLAGEFKVGAWSCGFDTAYNLGHQNVSGVDRNVIVNENRDGFIAIVNSHVLQEQAGIEKKALYVPLNQEIIDPSGQCSDLNGAIIGTNNLGTLKNSLDRFKDPYINEFRGSMFVWDISYIAIDPSLVISATIGYASGDENPNSDLLEPGECQKDRVYTGFIGVMESYIGYRVKSAYLLSGSGKIPRVLSFPSGRARNSEVYSVSRFTNLIYGGIGSDIKPQCWNRKWKFNPNCLFYWQDNPTTYPVEVSGVEIRKSANSFLGTELNLFSSVELLPDLNFWLITSGFLPGGHYTDIKGKPLNKLQQRFIERRSRTGVVGDPVPLLGDDNSWYLNFGLTYSF